MEDNSHGSVTPDLDRAHRRRPLRDDQLRGLDVPRGDHAAAEAGPLLHAEGEAAAVGADEALVRHTHH